MRLFCKNIFLVLGFAMFATVLFAQPADNQDFGLPHAFIIGEYEADYERMVNSCDDHLLTVCDDSMDEAYNLWLRMLDDIETYAKEKSFDINGVKIWMTVYWNYDGTVQHIVYYPKPNSKNMDFEKLTDFFNGFSEVYTFPKQSTSCFSHYGSASFPSFSQNRGN